MNTIQINEIMKNDKFTKNCFIGTFALNKLPKIKFYPCCLILNNKPDYHNGQHWLAIYFHKNKTAEFFDSFGNHPSFYNVVKYLENNSVRFKYNKTRLQSHTSYYCGLYCCFYLFNKSRNKSLNYFLKQFKSPMKNDYLFTSIFYLLSYRIGRRSIV